MKTKMHSVIEDCFQQEKKQLNVQLLNIHFALGVGNNELCSNGSVGIPEGPERVAGLWDRCGRDDHRPITFHPENFERGISPNPA